MLIEYNDNPESIQTITEFLDLMDIETLEELYQEHLEYNEFKVCDLIKKAIANYK